MKTKVLAIILLGIICLWIIALPTIVVAQAERIYQENNKAVVVILTYDKENRPLAQGSGFIVRSDGAIVTNLHVVSQAASIKVKVAKDRHLEVEGVLHCDEANDLIILKAKGKNLPILKLGDSDKIKEGEKVYVIGSPAGLENTISDGIISGIRGLDQNQKVIQISAPVSQGSSGGPVFNERGEVIGVATFIVEDAQNLNFAMPVSLIRTKINNRKVLPLEKTITADYTKTAEYWFWQGCYLQKAKKYKKAIECFKEAIRLEPDNPNAHYGLGYTYAEFGDYEQAIKSYQQVLRNDPDCAFAHVNLGRIYDDLGDNKKATKSYQQAIRSDPDCAYAYYNLAFQYSFTSDKNDEVIKLCKQAIRSDPDFAEAHWLIGVIHGRLKDYKKAIASHKQAIRLKPDYAGAHITLALIYIELGDRSRALVQYRVLKNLDKEMAESILKAIYEIE